MKFESGQSVIVLDSENKAAGAGVAQAKNWASNAAKN
jgi:hypothetical protein